MLRDICEELDIDPTRLVMIGDTTHDLRMAAAIGATAVAVGYGAHPVPELQACAPAALRRRRRPGLRAWLLPRVTSAR